MEYAGLNSFQWMMLNLDAALTQVASRHIASQMKFKPSTALAWLQDSQAEWYLSDGGYSRIVYSQETGKLSLTSNSTPRVKQAWDRCIELREDIEHELSLVVEEAL
jgi:hypothetical protein